MRNITHAILTSLIFAFLLNNCLANDGLLYQKAFNEFKNLATELSGTNQMPTINNSKAKKLLITLSDSKQFLNKQQYNASDLDYLFPVCSQSYAMFVYYRLDGKA
ncbi:MAG: hypothetical protein Tsb005_20620 [Gammaproteobacteria bacterium]